MHCENPVRSNLRTTQDVLLDSTERGVVFVALSFMFLELFGLCYFGAATFSCGIQYFGEGSSALKQENSYLDANSYSK